MNSKAEVLGYGNDFYVVLLGQVLRDCGRSSELALKPSSHHGPKTALL